MNTTSKDAGSSGWTQAGPAAKHVREAGHRSAKAESARAAADEQAARARQERAEAEPRAAESERDPSDIGPRPNANEQRRKLCKNEPPNAIRGYRTATTNPETLAEIRSQFRGAGPLSPRITTPYKPRSRSLDCALFGDPR